MSLIKCPYCGEDISDLAKRCVHCGKNLDNKKVFNQDVYNELVHEETCIIQENSPVCVKGISIVSKGNEDKIYVFCEFEPLVAKSIQAIVADFKCYDTWGNKTQNISEYQYLDLRTTRGESFGTDHLIELPDNTTRAVDIIIKKVRFVDRTLIECGYNKYLLPEKRIVKDVINNELYTKYLRQTNIYQKVVEPRDYNAGRFMYIAVQGDNYWRCSCGEINNSSEEKCFKCRNDKSFIFNIQNEEYLRERDAEYEERMRKAAEEKQKELERLREEAEKKRQEEEREREKEQELKREEAEKLEAEKTVKRKKKKRRIILTFMLILLITAGAMLAAWYLYSNHKYDNANNYMNDGKYDKAYEEFMEIKDFKDSRKLAEEAIYRKGMKIKSESSAESSVSITLNDDAADDNSLSEINYKKKIYCHIKYMSTSSESVQLRAVFIWPDYSVLKYKFDSTYISGDICSFYVQDDKYDSDDLGKLIVRVYNKNTDEFLGESSIELVD